MVLETKLRLDNYRTMGPGLYCTAEIHVDYRRFQLLLPIYQWDLSRLPQQYRCTGLLGRAGPELYQLVLAMVSLTKSLVLVRTAPSPIAGDTLPLPVCVPTSSLHLDSIDTPCQPWTSSTSCPPTRTGTPQYPTVLLESGHVVLQKFCERSLLGLLVFVFAVWSI